MSIQEKLEKYKTDLELFDNNMDKYQYLITLGSKSSMSEEYRLDTFKVHGCMSQVLLVPKYNESTISFISDSGNKFIICQTPSCIKWKAITSYRLPNYKSFKTNTTGHYKYLINFFDE